MTIAIKSNKYEEKGKQKKKRQKKQQKKNHCSSKNTSMTFFVTAFTGVALYPLLLFLYIHKIIITNKTYIALSSFFLKIITILSVWNIFAISFLDFFSRVNATLEAAMSVGRSVGLLVGP